MVLLNCSQNIFDEVGRILFFSKKALPTFKITLLIIEIIKVLNNKITTVFLL